MSNSIVRGGNTQYTSPIGPQPMNSSTPWAVKTAGERGGIFGQEGFVPRMPSNPMNLSDGGIIAPITRNVKKQKKLADGGITGLISKFLPPPLGPMLNMMINPGGAMGGIGKAVGGIGGAVSSGFQMLTNPTKLIGDGLKAVLPMNRNIGKDLFGGGDKRKTENITKVLKDLPAIFAGGTMAGFIGMVARSSPVLGLILNAAKPIIKPLLDAIGLPASVLGAIFGGSPSSAATMPQDNQGNGDDNGGDGNGGDGNGENPPSGTPGTLMADLQADVGKTGSQMRSEITSSGATGTVDPTQQPWCAAYVNSQLKRNGIQGSGSAMADSFLNWGAPVDKKNIQPGDVIVGDYGAGSRSHVMFAAGTPKDGYVDIIGGNQSGKVTRGSIALSKIDGVRRATTSQTPQQPEARPSQRPTAVSPTATPSAPRTAATPRPNPPRTGAVRTKQDTVGGNGGSTAKSGNRGNQASLPSNNTTASGFGVTPEKDHLATYYRSFAGATG
jgi:uncharacterized protein (TIGR02594 family)